MLDTCVTCGSTAIEHGASFHETRHVGRHSAQVISVGDRCRTCGETYVSGEDVASVNRALAERLVERGELDGSVVRFVRKALGWSGRDLAGILGVAAETVSRWENERKEIDAPLRVVLNLLFAAELRGDHAVRGLIRRVRDNAAPEGVTGVIGLGVVGPGFHCEVRFAETVVPRLAGESQTYPVAA